MRKAWTVGKFLIKDFSLLSSAFTINQFLVGAVLSTSIFREVKDISVITKIEFFLASAGQGFHF